MCAPLTVTCQQHKHHLTLPKHLIPCKSPGSKLCKSGQAPETQTWQVSPTDCVARKLSNGTWDVEKCIENLAEYGERVWRMNEGVEKERKKKEKEKEKDGKGGMCVVQ